MVFCTTGSEHNRHNYTVGVEKRERGILLCPSIFRAHLGDYSVCVCGRQSVCYTYRKLAGVYLAETHVFTVEECECLSLVFRVDVLPPRPRHFKTNPTPQKTMVKIFTVFRVYLSTCRTPCRNVACDAEGRNERVQRRSRID